MIHTNYSRQWHRWILALLVTGFLPFSATGQNLPPLLVQIHDTSASKGYYFLTPYTNSPPYIYDHAQLILDQFGKLVYFRMFENSTEPNPSIDFKLQPNGQMSYFHVSREKFFLMDSTFMVVDSIGCVNGFETDQHDLQILDDGHYLLFGTEIRIMNLTSYHWFGLFHNMPGSANAQVSGVVIQEFDENKNLIWEWKGHDHYGFGDADSIWMFTPGKVDWTHANAVERDNDGNILLSLRHFNEVTKINRSTGNIIWRLGGKRNQFSFPNDPVRFTGQHDIRRVGPNTVSLFDNGQHSNPPRSRAVEYELNEADKVAMLSWEYIYDENMFSYACGNHQVTDNGNHVVDFGFTNSLDPWMVMVGPGMEEILEVTYPQGYISYRAFNYESLPWRLNRPVVECQKSGDDYYLVAEPGHPSYLWTTGDTSATVLITDTGEYQVFVPYGTGYLGSEPFVITDPVHPCTFLQVTPEENLQEATMRIYPNPAAGRANVVFTLPERGMVSLELYNSLGIRIRTVTSGVWSAGVHQLAVDISGIQPGVCYLTMTSGGKPQVNKLVIRGL